MKHNGKYSDREWEKYAGLLSGETTYSSRDGKTGSPVDPLLEKYWKSAGGTSNISNIDVDKAWNRVKSGITISESGHIPVRRINPAFLRAAAAVLLLTVIGTSLLFLPGRTGTGKTKLITAGADESNKEIVLPDGSRIWINRNSELSYSWKKADAVRKVALRGEGFFEIIPELSKPFIVDAGKAEIKVTGTSFNVITSNNEGDVEVYVETGKVLLSSGVDKSIEIVPGYVGRASPRDLNVSLNDNRNYMAWRTGLLVYEGARLGDVFNDLKKIYNINLTSEEPAIKEQIITATFDKEPPETIINIICTTFNFNYKKEGNSFHLYRK